MFTLTGTLKDHAGKPVADSAVVIIPSPSMTKDASGNTVYLGGTTVYTNSSGVFTASLVADEDNIVYTVRSAYGGPLDEPIHFNSPADGTTVNLSDVTPVMAPKDTIPYATGLPTTANDGQILTYDESSGKWVARSGTSVKLGTTVYPQVDGVVTLPALLRTDQSTALGRTLLGATSEAGIRNTIGLGTANGYPFLPTVRGWVLGTADLDTYQNSTQAGSYGVISAAANTPADMGPQGTLTVWTTPDSNGITQWVTAPNGAWWRVGTRTAEGVTWQTWRKVATLSDIPSDIPGPISTNSRPEPTWLTTFTPGHGWVRSGADGTITDTTVNTVMGNALLMETAAASGSKVIADRPNINLDLSEAILGMWVHVEDLDFLASITVYAFGSTDMTGNYWGWRPLLGTASAPWIRDGEWAYINLPFPAATSLSSATPPSRTNPVRSLRVRIDSRGGSPARVRLGAIGTQPDRHPAFPDGVVTIVFDDGYTSTLERAARMSMTRRGWSGTVAAIPETVGNTGFMTLDQYYELKHLHGWDVEAHNVAEATSLTDAELRTQWAGDQEWVRSNGLGESRHLIWPRGYADARTARVASEFFVSARTIDYMLESGLETMPAAMPYRLRSQSFMAAAPAIAVVERAAATGQWAILTFHKVVADGDWVANGLEISQTDFDLILDRIEQLGLPVRTLDEVWRAIT